MPRLEVPPPRKNGSSRSFSIPWKVLFILCAIGGVWAYIAYQYVQFRPAPSRGRVAMNKAQANRGRNATGGDRAASPRPFDEALKKVYLTSAQESQIADIAKETTTPMAFQRKAMKVLTPDQRDILTSGIQTARAERAKARQEAEARRRRMLPGRDFDIAKEANARIKAETQARRRAANPNATPTPTPKKKKKNP